MLEKDFEKRTARLVVRPYRETDYAVWKSTFSTLPEAQSIFDAGPRPVEDLTRAKFEAVLELERKERAGDSFYSFMGFEQETGRLVGGASLMDISRALFQNAYLGYRVFSPYWRMGYGREMAQAVIDIAFHELKLHRVEAGIEPENHGSIALAQSLKMRFEGVSARRLFMRGQWVDCRLYALTAEDVGVEFAAESVSRR